MTTAKGDGSGTGRTVADADLVDDVVDAWRRERPDLDVSSSRIVTPVIRLATLVADGRGRVLDGTELDQGHLDTLGMLRRAGPPYRLTAGELSRRCRVTPGATTQRVATLERLGCVRRIREEPDRRTVHVELTERGRHRHDELFADVTAADEHLLARLDASERERLELAVRGWLRAIESGGLDG